MNPLSQRVDNQRPYFEGSWGAALETSDELRLPFFQRPLSLTLSPFVPHGARESPARDRAEMTRSCPPRARRLPRLHPQWRRGLGRGGALRRLTYRAHLFLNHQIITQRVCGVFASRPSPNPLPARSSRGEGNIRARETRTAGGKDSVKIRPETAGRKNSALLFPGGGVV